MIKYKHLLTFRMVDFNGNVAYDTAEIIEYHNQNIKQSEFEELEQDVISKNHTQLASIVLVNSMVIMVDDDD